MSNTAYPARLARQVQSVLRKQRKRGLRSRWLVELFELLYACSLKTEEGAQLRCTVIILNPDRPDPDPPPSPPASRWTVSKFEKPIPLTDRNLTKLAQAVDPAASSLAVFATEQGGLFIWGIVDQEVHFHRFVSRYAESGPSRPGLFQAIIDGVGSITVYQGYSVIASLKQTELAWSFTHVFHVDPLEEIFYSYVRDFEDRVERVVGNRLEAGGWSTDQEMGLGIGADLLAALQRILSLILRYQHGGAVRITPTRSNRSLNIKYPMKYERLADALIRHAITSILRGEIDDKIDEHFEVGAIMVSKDTYLDGVILEGDRNDIRDEIDGCVHTIASLSRVDGLVLMDGALRVRGFGVEIRSKKEPANVVLGSRVEGGKIEFRSVPLGHYGTRHRSMVRYCYQNPGAVGFVVSQDGTIRAITRRADDVLICDNVDVNLRF